MMPNLDTGRVRIRLTCNHDRVSSVAVSSERPNVVPVLRGRQADQAVQLLPLLYALCGQAQAQAALLALAAARGEASLPHLSPFVQREVLREHLWRCLLDLPPLLGEPALQQEFIHAAKWVAEGKRERLHALLTSPRIATLRANLIQSGEPAGFTPVFLPALDAQASLAEWPRLSAEFSHLPNWRGGAAETGALARQIHRYDNQASYFSARWSARFDELLAWAAGNERIGTAGTMSAAPVANGIGRSLAETARGLLMHEIVLDGDVVADYIIVAPTEWNFHPQGMLAEQLHGLKAADRSALQQQVARTVAALDPCVPWELEWA